VHAASDCQACRSESRSRHPCSALRVQTPSSLARGLWISAWRRLPSHTPSLSVNGRLSGMDAVVRDCRGPPASHSARVTDVTAAVPPTERLPKLRNPHRHEDRAPLTEARSVSGTRATSSEFVKGATRQTQAVTYQIAPVSLPHRRAGRARGTWVCSDSFVPSPWSCRWH